MAVRTSFSAGEVLLAADLTDTFGAKSPSASPTFTGTVVLPVTTDYDGVQLSTTLAAKSNVTVGLSDVSASVHTFQLSDAGKLVTVSASAGGVELTIPAEASASFANGSVVGVVWLGAASAVSIVAASGVTLNSTIGSGSPVPLSEQFAGAQCYKTGADTWIAVGSLA